MSVDRLGQVCFWGSAAGFILSAAAYLFLFLLLAHRVRGGTPFSLRGRLPSRPGATPRAAVVLCLRGADPQTKRCLEALRELDYPDYSVIVIVDSEADPAWRLAQRTAESSEVRFRVELLADRNPRRSLKCSAILQANALIGDDVELLAFVDGDVIPHRGWLRALAETLANERVGVACGIRWHAVSPAGAGAIGRYAFNMFSAVATMLNCCPWGGTLAVRRRTLRDAVLLDMLSKAFVEDTLYHSYLERSGLTMALSPALVMFNDAPCRFPSFLAWATRQTTNTRLYHSHWPWMLFSCFGSIGLMTAVTISAVLSAGLGAWLHFGVASGTLVLSSLMIFCGYASLELALQDALGRRGEVGNRERGWVVAALLAGPAAAVLFPFLLLRAHWRRVVRWRGIAYRIRGPWRVEMLEYRPFLSAETDRTSGAAGDSAEAVVGAASEGAG